MNVAEYRQAVRLQLGLAADDAVIPDSIVLWALNGAVKSIATEKDWPWLYTEEEVFTTDEDATLPLPSDYTRTVFITVDGQQPITPRTHIDLARDRTGTGRPWAYVVEANSLRLYPIPDDAYPVVHAFYRSEPELVQETDAPLLPDAYSERLVYEAAIKTAVRTNHTERLQALREEAVDKRKAMTDNYVRMNKPGRILQTKESSWPVIW